MGMYILMSCTLLHGSIITVEPLPRQPLYSGHLYTMATYFGGQSIHRLLLNPLNPNIKIEILIYCPYTIQ